MRGENERGAVMRRATIRRGRIPPGRTQDGQSRWASFETRSHPVPPAVKHLRLKITLDKWNKAIQASDRRKHSSRSYTISVFSCRTLSICIY